MKKIQEILAAKRPISEIIKDLKVKRVPVPAWSDLQKQYEPMLHRIFTDPTVLPDKSVYDENDQLLRMEPSTKIAIGLQKLAAKRMGEFMYTLPAALTCEEAKTKPEVKDQFLSFRKVLKRNRWDALNKRRCRINSSQCEQAVYWYIVDSGADHLDYGFKTRFKIKHQVFTPANGDSLYPLFDDTGDMIAFSRETTILDMDGKVRTFFDCWTAEKYYQWVKTAGDEWAPTEGKSGIKNDIGKIPIIYGYREKPIWEDADNGKVHEMEMLLSRNGETIAYHSSPVLVIKGELEGAPTKGEANKVFVTKDGTGGAEYAYWPQTPESVKFQFETLRAQFFAELQLPDLSLENIKGLGATSGEARKWLLADAHLKVGDESEIYTDITDREFNVIKACLGVINQGWKNTISDLEIDAEIRPFTIQSRKDDIEVIIAANGNKPTISQKTSVELGGLVDDADAEYKQILKEAAEEVEAQSKMNVFQTAE